VCNALAPLPPVKKIAGQHSSLGIPSLHFHLKMIAIEKMLKRLANKSRGGAFQCAAKSGKSQGARNSSEKERKEWKSDIVEVRSNPSPPLR
jgi:hypothetical protein